MINGFNRKIFQTPNFDIRFILNKSSTQNHAFNANIKNNFTTKLITHDLPISFLIYFLTSQRLTR